MGGGAERSIWRGWLISLVTSDLDVWGIGPTLPAMRFGSSADVVGAG